MDYSLLADYDKHHRISLDDALLTKAQEAAAATQLTAQCGQCINYRAERTRNGTQLWGHCTLRAAADIHPCNLPPWDEYAAQCSFYEQEVPF